MTDINDEFLDVDLEKDPNYIFGDLGLAWAGELCGNYEAENEVYSESRIDEEIENIDAAGGGADLMVTRIFDQDAEGACVLNAFCQGHETRQAVQYGKDKVIHLSAISCYDWVASSSQSGTTVEAGIRQITQVGPMPLDNAENRARFGDQVKPNTGFRKPYPLNWKATAAKLKGGEYHIVRTKAGLWTALCKQQPVIVGRSGHSIAYLCPKRRNGKRVAKYANSWKESWGDNGFGYDSESMVSQSARWAVVLRTVNIFA